MCIMARVNRADDARRAVLSFYPQTVDDGISEYLADTVVSLLEDAEDRRSVQQELVETVSPFLEDAGVSSEIFKEVLQLQSQKHGLLRVGEISNNSINNEIEVFGALLRRNWI